IITVLSFALLLLSWYNSYQFDHNPISSEIKEQVKNKQIHLVKLIKKKYQINFKVPLIITDKMNSSLFGMTTYDSQINKITIYLNKKRFKESLDYMINDVMPHEYAHAMMFRFGDFSSLNAGHTLQWQKVCLFLEGNHCDRFVNHNDILIDKKKLFY
ncbi:MAG: SprT-like domain-containing protein, partial [Campylobacteraceae bacterium]|nr:SprT-like domain-containing protein [Campylobacteraceae bacterium]